MKKEFEIIAYDNINALSSVITTRLNDGWMLYGKPFYSAIYDTENAVIGSNGLICQAMIKNVSFKPQQNDSTTKSNATTD